MKPVASIVITYYMERLKQLDRCLYLLRNQTVAVEIVLAYDGDGPGEQPRVDRMVKMRDIGTGRAPNKGFLAGYKAATSDYIIHCPPEMLVPYDAVERMLAGHQTGHRDVPTFLGINKATTEVLDNLPWREDLSCIKDTPGFWHTWGPLAMTNLDGQWCNWHLNFCGAMRDEWERFGILPDTDEAGQNENWLADMEAAAGPTTSPIQSPVTVYHQWHPIWSGVRGGKPVGLIQDAVRPNMASNGEPPAESLRIMRTRGTGE